MTAPDHTLDAALVRLESLLGAATKGVVLEVDEPCNWHGVAARIHPKGSGDLFATVDLAGWGEARGRTIANAIAAAVNAADAFVALAKAAQKVAAVGLWSTDRDTAMTEMVAALEGLAKVLPC